MGAKISKEPIEKAGNWPPGSGREFDDPFPVNVVSPSRFYCQVQQLTIWTDYYIMYDMRGPGEYKKNHIVNAKQAWSPSEGVDWAWEMVVLIYGNSHTDAGVKKLMDALISGDAPPAQVYILEGPFKYFAKRFKPVLYKSGVAEYLPGPVELVPPTATNPGTYAIHRVHFLRSKQFTARLKIGTIINISARRLFVKTPGIVVENSAFSSDPAPGDFCVGLYNKYAGMKPKGKGKKNILIIDEPGCDYATILAGYHLVKFRKCREDDVVDSMTQRSGFLDTWYTDVISEWT